MLCTALFLTICCRHHHITVYETPTAADSLELKFINGLFAFQMQRCGSNFKNYRQSKENSHIPIPCELSHWAWISRAAPNILLHTEFLLGVLENKCVVFFKQKIGVVSDYFGTWPQLKSLVPPPHSVIPKCRCTTAVELHKCRADVSPI